MEQVFLLWHVVERVGADDEKLIGVYRAEAGAKAAIERLRDKPGFTDFRDGFLIDPYELDGDHWTEGFVESAV